MEQLNNKLKNRQLGITGSRRPYELELLFKSTEKRGLPTPENVSRVLDVGCGNSDTVKMIAEGWNAQWNRCDVEGDVDIIKEGVLPYEDNIFDLILCYQVLHHIPWDLLEIEVSEIGRVIKSEGFLVVREHDVEDETVRELVEKEHNFYPREIPIYLLQSEEKWIEQLGKVGFTHLHTQRFSRNNPTRYITMLFRC